MQIIVASLALGVAGDLLLRVGPWGLNMVLWLTAVLGVTGWLVRRQGQTLDRRAAWLGAAAWLFGGGLAWRNSEVLTWLNLGSAAVLMALGLARAHGARVWRGGVTEHLWRVAVAAAGAAAGYLPLFQGQSWWTPGASASWGARARAVVVGMLLAAPLLILFSVLLASADFVFRELLGRLIDFNLSDVMSHAAPIAVGAWVVAGWLVTLLFQPPAGGRMATLPRFVTLGPVEIGVAFGLVNALFLFFLLIQCRYLFGGADLVQVTPGLTYADYARRGFFELVAVVAIAVPALLAGEWLLGANPRRGFRWHAGLMVGFLAVILASAWYRLWLYQSEYGWTEARFFVTAFMVWLVMILAWFAATVLTGRRSMFTGGALLAALAAVVVLNVWNPAAWIAGRNVERGRVGRGFDPDYAVRLGADAVPVLVSGLNGLAPEDQARLRAGWAAAMSAETDWRTWNGSRAAARRHLLAAGLQPETPPVERPLPLE